MSSYNTKLHDLMYRYTWSRELLDKMLNAPPALFVSTANSLKEVPVEVANIEENTPLIHVTLRAVYTDPTSLRLRIMQ